MPSDPDAVPIPVPKEMVNDDSYLVVALLAEPGAQVAKGQPLAELETSKASFTLASPADGYFRPDFAAGQMVGVGASFGAIGLTQSARGAPAPAEKGGPGRLETAPDSRFSLAAWELFAASGLSPEPFDGLVHVRRADVEAVLAARGGDRPAGGAPDPAKLREDEKYDAVVLLGGGGHARECIEIIEQAGVLNIFGIVDTKSRPGDRIAGHPVLGDNAMLLRLREAGLRNLVLAYGIAGNHAARGEHFRRLLELGHEFPPIVHPKAAVNREAKLGRGVQVMGGALVGSRAEIGDAGIVNSNAVVSHDCVLGSNVHVAPGALLAGGVGVGADTVIGMGATVYMRVRIGSGVIVYNGARVFADVPDGAVVRGDHNE